MALALAMAHVIIREGIYDREFVENYCSGFDRLKEHVEKYSPEWAAGVTGLAEEDIVKAARMYATVKPGCISRAILSTPCFLAKEDSSFHFGISLSFHCHS